MPYSLPKAIKIKIGETLGMPIQYPGDCERLALDIRLRLNETIGVTTIKRLFGYAQDILDPRTSTLDLLARYAGYASYDEMKKDLCPEGDSAFEERPDIDSADLNPGDRVIFEYLPDRKVVLEYTGNNNYRVESSENSSLQAGDTVYATYFNLNHPLRINSVVRGGKNMGSYTAGKVSGLTSLSLDKL